VEGFVLCEDGLFFEHIWNRIICNNDELDFDVTLSVIASEAEKNAKKTYYEYKNWSFAEMLERKSTSNLAFSQESDSIISDYYDNVNSEHKERYYQSKEILQNEHRRI
jgi:hypothetical protein